MKSNRSFPRIGILGGAGPMAGIQLFQKIIKICQEKYSCREDADFPYIMLINYPFSDMLNHPGKLKILLRKQLNDCFIELLRNEIKIAAIACNTLHEFLDRQISEFSLVHMIKETALLLQQQQIDNTYVLCSTTSSRCQLHRKHFDCSYPEDNTQAYVQNLINKILNGKLGIEDSQNLATMLNALQGSFLKIGKKSGLVLGCTELSVLNEQFPLRANGLCEDLIIIDPSQLVAERICKIIFNK